MFFNSVLKFLAVEDTVKKTKTNPVLVGNLVIHHFDSLKLRDTTRGRHNLKVAYITNITHIWNKLHHSQLGTVRSFSQRQRNIAADITFTRVWPCCESF